MIKNAIAFVVVLMISNQIALGQSDFRIGVKGGVNFASIKSNFYGNYRGIIGYHVGGLVEIPIINKVSLQPELLFSTQGVKRDDRGGDDTQGALVVTKLSYINIPMLMKYYLTDHLSFAGGPQAGILVAAKNEITPSGDVVGATYHEENIKKDIENMEIGLAFGAEYKLPIGIFFQLKYVLGLSNINDSSSNIVLGNFYYEGEKSKNRVFQVSAGYSF